MLKRRRRVDGGGGSLRVLARVACPPSFDNIYIYFFTCYGSSRDLYEDTKEEMECIEIGNRFVACRYRFERPSN